MERRVPASFLAVLVGVGLWACLLPTRTSSAPRSRDSSTTTLATVDAVGDLSRGIQALNLVNALYLTPEQVAKLKPILREAESLRVTGERARAQLAPRLEQALKAVKEDLLVRGAVTEAVKGRYHQVHSRLQDLQDQRRDAVRRLAGQARTVLTENQLTIVAEYKPCIIAPRSLRDPVRAGQASGHTEAEYALDRVHRLSDAQYERARPEIFQKLEKLWARHEEPPVVQRKLKEAAAILDEVRRLSDADYQLRRADLAARLLPADRAPRTGRELDECIVRNLLDPAVLTWLERRSTAGR